jgi:hypothetical protein
MGKSFYTGFTRVNLAIRVTDSTGARLTRVNLPTLLSESTGERLTTVNFPILLTLSSGEGVTTVNLAIRETSRYSGPVAAMMADDDTELRRRDIISEHQ